MACTTPTFQGKFILGNFWQNLYNWLSNANKMLKICLKRPKIWLRSYPTPRKFRTDKVESLHALMTWYKEIMHELIKPLNISYRLIGMIKNYCFVILLLLLQGVSPCDQRAMHLIKSRVESLSYAFDECLKFRPPLSHISPCRYVLHHLFGRANIYK